MNAMGCRAHIVAHLPGLQMLDGRAVGPHEPQQAVQVLRHQEVLMALMLTTACLVHKLVNPCFCHPCSIQRLLCCPMFTAAWSSSYCNPHSVVLAEVLSFVCWAQSPGNDTQTNCGQACLQICLHLLVPCRALQYRCSECMQS